jgi:tryptophanyl-tRNA synthetase
MHKIYSPVEMQEEIISACRKAEIGCGDCKLKLAGNLLKSMYPKMEKRKEIAAKPKEVYEILRAGTEKARGVAKATLQEAKTAMKII